jgi:phosphoadenosine phosphosulfate reductase
MADAEKSSLPPMMSPERIAREAERLEAAAPEEVISWAAGEFGDQLAIGTGFGIEGMVLIDMVAEVVDRPSIFFIDTAFLFSETYELRRTVEARYGITIQAVEPDLTPDAQEKAHGPDLWARDPDLCCRLRKIDPLEKALRGRHAWMTAIRRDQTVDRASARVVEPDPRRRIVKINPLLRWTRREVWSYVERFGVPYNPLFDRGYASVGCTHCTRGVADGEGERAGRWPGHAKTECGLHYGPGPVGLRTPTTPGVGVQSEEARALEAR